MNDLKHVWPRQYAKFIIIRAKDTLVSNIKFWKWASYFEDIWNILTNQFLNHAIQNLDKKSVTISVIYNFLTLLIIICGFAKLLLVIKNHICSEMACARVHLWICLTWRKEKIAILLEAKKCNSKILNLFLPKKHNETWSRSNPKKGKHKIVKTRSWISCRGEIVLIILFSGLRLSLF